MVELDVTTYYLGAVISIALFLIWFTNSPPPQAHPFLLGRQSNNSPTRFISESPIYLNSSTGGIRAALRPEKRIRNLKDILDGSLTRFEGGKRGTWIKGGERLVDIVEGLRAGLLSSLVKEGEGVVAVLIDDPTDALLVTLALALTKYTPLVVSPGSSLPISADLIIAVIHSSTQLRNAKLLTTTIDAKWISVGAKGENSSIAEDLLITGLALVANKEVAPVHESMPTDLALTIVSEGVTLKYTHLNLSAALVSWLSMYPASPRPTRPTVNDTILSFHHPSTPYGFGLALFIIYTSASLSLPTLPGPNNPEALDALLGSASCPAPSRIFGPAPLLSSSLYSLLLQKMMGDAPFIIKRARDGKLRLLRKGIISTTTFWDTILFDGLRKDVNLINLKGLVLAGPIEQNKSDFFRLALGSSVISSCEHSFLLAPLSAGGMWDFQRLPPPGAKHLSGTEIGHVGAPITGLELKLKGDEKEISQGRMIGEILIRSPLLPTPSSLPAELLLSDNILPQLPPYPNSKPVVEDLSQWLKSGIRAEMSNEGVLWLQ